MKNKKLILNLNNNLDYISSHLHKKTGYSLIHSVLEANNDYELRVKYGCNFFVYNSDEWQFFIELLQEACK